MSPMFVAVFVLVCLLAFSLVGWLHTMDIADGRHRLTRRQRRAITRRRADLRRVLGPDRTWRSR